MEGDKNGISIQQAFIPAQFNYDRRYYLNKWEFVYVLMVKNMFVSYSKV